MSKLVLKQWQKPTILNDKALTDRFKVLDLLERIIEGKQYDNLEYDFYTGYAPNGDYIPLRSRVPSVQCGLPKVIVHDSTSLLFGDTHFPFIQTQDKDVQNTIADMIEEYGLQLFMLTVARMGSVGSVAIEVRIIDGKIITTPLQTKNLTPVYSPTDPNRLVKVVQRYKVLGAQLNASGLYDRTVFESGSTYWFHAVWDILGYTHYEPYSDKSDTDFQPKALTDLSDTHNLGFVPIIWIKNLPCIDPTSYDGTPTFGLDAVSISTELDYQMSQNGRALTYAADPITVIKEGDDVDEEGEGIVRTSDNIITVSKGGDAKMLEITGDGSKAVLDFCKELRERIMELVRGNRTSPDKLAAATSGYAIELMNLALVSLVKELRVTYGKNGLVPLIKMIAAISEQVSFTLNGIDTKLVIANPLKLKWPDFYDETASDKQIKSSALQVLVSSGLLPEEVAREEACLMFDVTVQDVKEAGLAMTYREPATPGAPPEPKTKGTNQDPAPVIDGMKKK